MPLNPIIPGLRRLKNDSHDVAKVALTIPAGDVVEVSDDVAAQLEAQGNFRDPETVPEVAPQIVKDANGQPAGMSDGSPLPDGLAEDLGLVEAPQGAALAPDFAKMTKAELLAFAAAQNPAIGVDSTLRAAEVRAAVVAAYGV